MRIIPFQTTIAETMDDIFKPDECKQGEVIGRRGKIRLRNGMIEDYILVAEKQEYLNYLLLTRGRTEDWSISMGSGSLHEYANMLKD